MTDRTRRAWLWLRVHGATPAEATYLSRVHPDVDPGRRSDVHIAADLLVAHRGDSRPWSES